MRIFRYALKTEKTLNPAWVDYPTSHQNHEIITQQTRHILSKCTNPTKLCNA